MVPTNHHPSERNTMKTTTAALALSACQDQASSGGAARDYISAVGSSTVYPFATAVGEKFAEATGNKTPKIFKPEEVA